MPGKSFGARMLAKMGYVEGQGLGKDGQGRSNVIEANLRPQGVGLGAVKEKTKGEREEEIRQAQIRGETIVESDDEETKRKRAKAKKRKLGDVYNSDSSTSKKKRSTFLTAEELKASAPGLHIPEAFAPILDMTGPGESLLKSASGIITPTFVQSESPEVEAARKLAKRAHADLAAFSDEWRSLQERKASLNLELQQTHQHVEDLHADFQRLQLFSTWVSDQLVVATTWEEVHVALQQLGSFGTPVTAQATDILVAAIHPFFQDWDPLQEPSRFTSELNDISHLLTAASGGSAHQAGQVDKWATPSSGSGGDGIYRRHHKATTAYETMMYKCWLPQVLAASRSWDALNPSPMLEVMEHWNDLLPAFVKAQFMDNIARKLNEALSSWNPRMKQSSGDLPHRWLFPWLPYLPAYHLDVKGTGLVADVKRKFRHLIDTWDYSRGVIPGLAQWQDILGEEWRRLIMSHVLPSMSKYLVKNFRVDPANQEPYMPALTGLLKWEKVLGGEALAEVFVQHLMPMWSEKLREWIMMEDADLAEVAEWYSWWRGSLLKTMLAVDSNGQKIGTELDKGLLVMNMG